MIQLEITLTLLLLNALSIIKSLRIKENTPALKSQKPILTKE